MPSLRLLAGEGEFLQLESEPARRRIQDELQGSEPQHHIYRGHPPPPRSAPSRACPDGWPSEAAGGHPGVAATGDAAVASMLPVRPGRAVGWMWGGPLKRPPRCLKAAPRPRGEPRPWASSFPICSGGEEKEPAGGGDGGGVAGPRGGLRGCRSPAGGDSPCGGGDGDPCGGRSGARAPALSTPLRGRPAPVGTRLAQPRRVHPPDLVPPGRSFPLPSLRPRPPGEPRRGGAPVSGWRMRTGGCGASWRSGPGDPAPEGSPGPVLSAHPPAVGEGGSGSRSPLPGAGSHLPASSSPWPSPACFGGTPSASCGSWDAPLRTWSGDPRGCSQSIGSPWVARGSRTGGTHCAPRPAPREMVLHILSGGRGGSRNLLGSSSRGCGRSGSSSL